MEPPGPPKPPDNDPNGALDPVAILGECPVIAVQFSLLATAGALGDHQAALAALEEIFELAGDLRDLLTALQDFIPAGGDESN
jgi:hypothetical protein